MKRRAAGSTRRRPHSIVTRSAAQTVALGRRLGRLIEPGDFVGLIGPVGAGKTTFVRGVAGGAGVRPRDVASPSFAIVYPYRGRIPVCHVDLYRLDDVEELVATGYFDLLDESAVVVEWLDRIPVAAPAERLDIRFDDAGGARRELAFVARGKRGHELVRRLFRRSVSGGHAR